MSNHKPIKSPEFHIHIFKLYERKFAATTSHVYVISILCMAQCASRKSSFKNAIYSNHTILSPGLHTFKVFSSLPDEKKKRRYRRQCFWLYRHTVDSFYINNREDPRNGNLNFTTVAPQSHKNAQNLAARR
jgi:hypothetical protein